MSPSGCGFQILKGIVVMLGIASCLSPHREFLHAGVWRELKSVGIIGGSLGIAHCGIVGVCAKMVGCGRTEMMRRGLETSSGNSTKASFSMSLARATTVLTAHGIQACSLRRHF